MADTPTSSPTVTVSALREAIQPDTALPRVITAAEVWTADHSISRSYRQSLGDLTSSAGLKAIGDAASAAQEGIRKLQADLEADQRARLRAFSAMDLMAGRNALDETISAHQASVRKLQAELEADQRRVLQAFGTTDLISAQAKSAFERSVSDIIRWQADQPSPPGVLELISAAQTAAGALRHTQDSFRAAVAQVNDALQLSTSGEDAIRGVLASISAASALSGACLSDSFRPAMQTTRDLTATPAVAVAQFLADNAAWARTVAPADLIPQQRRSNAQALWDLQVARQDPKPHLLDSVAQHIAWHPSPADWRAVERRAAMKRMTPPAWLRQALREAILTVFTDEPGLIMSGCDANGPVALSDGLTADGYWSWFRGEVIYRARRLIYWQVTVRAVPGRQRAFRSRPPRAVPPATPARPRQPRNDRLSYEQASQAYRRAVEASRKDKPSNATIAQHCQPQVTGETVRRAICRFNREHKVWPPVGSDA
jgi:hypothetical protein